MEEIRDCNGRIACKGNATTGLVEVAYKRCRNSTHLPVGGTFTIEREGTVTMVSRISTNAFHIESHHCAA